LSRDFVIYDSTDQLTVIKQALREIGVDDSAVQPRAALSRISHAKNRMEGPETFTVNAWNPRDQQIGTLYEKYVKALKDANALDFDDLLLKSVELFEKSPSVRERYSEKFRFVMVDEYQDTNRPQYLLVQQLSAEASEFGGGGRPRSVDLQVARGRPEEHPRFRARFPGSRYRPTGAQLPLDAGHPRRLRPPSSRRTRNRKEKRLYTELKGGARILYYRAGDDLDEAEYIARTARTALHDDAANTVAVLYRTNAQSRTIEDALRRSGNRIQDHWRRPVLRAQGNQGCARVSQAHPQPARRRQPTPRHQRACPWYWQGRHGVARERRPARAREIFLRSSPACSRSRLATRCGLGWSARWTNASSRRARSHR
jgi:DNA helicase-2/ATP-dependent DNA helicase PcrA